MKFIAEFHGLKWQENGTISNYPSILKMRMGVDTKDDLKYDTSWDWLMPVCIKINQTPPIKDVLKDSIMPHITQLRKMKRGAINFDIQICYQGVVEFIKWYTSQNQKKG